MTSREKIQEVKNKILEKSELSSQGFISLRLHNIQHAPSDWNGIPDDLPITFSIKEQITVLEKFKQLNFIDFLSFDKNTAHFVVIAKEKLEKYFGENSEVKVHNGYLFLIGEKVLISTETDRETFQFFLLKKLLEKPYRKWSEDELVDDYYTFGYEEAKRKAFYTASRAIKEKIKKSLNIDDFLLYTTKDFKINKKYLS